MKCPHGLPSIPVGDDAVLDGILEGEDATLEVRLRSDEVVLPVWEPALAYYIRFPKIMVHLLGVPGMKILLFCCSFWFCSFCFFRGAGGRKGIFRRGDPYSRKCPNEVEP